MGEGGGINPQLAQVYWALAGNARARANAGEISRALGDRTLSYIQRVNLGVVNVVTTPEELPAGVTVVGSKTALGSTMAAGCMMT